LEGVVVGWINLEKKLLDDMVWQKTEVTDKEEEEKLFKNTKVVTE